MAQTASERARAYEARLKEKDPERWRRNNNARQNRYKKACRAEALAAYGGKCSCCGESNPAFLTFDHVDGRAAEVGRRKTGYALVFQIRREGYPVTYTVLCFNCNCGRQVNGGVCPHQETDVAVTR